MSSDDPKFTQVPNILFDELMSSMGNAELRVVLVAVRKMLGFHKTSDAISLTTFQKLSGLSRQGVMDGLAAAVKNGHLRQLPTTGKRGTTMYALCIGQDAGLVKPVDQSRELTSTSQASRPELVKLVDTQNKETKLTKEKLPPAGEPSPEPPQIYAFYVENIRQQITPLVRDGLVDAVKTYGEAWVQDAIKEAVFNNVPKWNYVAAILERWGKEGRALPRPTASNGKPANAPQQPTSAPYVSPGVDMNAVVAKLASTGDNDPSWTPQREASGAWKPQPKHTKTGSST